MYKYLGLGLMSLVAILMIPAAQNAESLTDPSMYGLATLTVYDSTGNALLTNTVHNIVVDTGTARMLANMFTDGSAIIGAIDVDQANGICLTDASDFGVDNGIDSTNFALAGGTGSVNNGLDGANGSSCKILVWTLTNTAATGALTNFAADDINVPNDTTITGFAVCDIDSGLDFCDTANVLVSAIGTSVTLATGETVDITYVLNLD